MVFNSLNGNFFRYLTLLGRIFDGSGNFFRYLFEGKVILCFLRD